MSTRRRLFVLIFGSVLGSLLVLESGLAQTPVRQVGRITCEASPSGGVPTSITVSREVTNSNTWTVVTPTPLTLSGTPLRSQPFVDGTRVTGTSYRYRCDFSNLAGTVSSVPVPTGGQVFLDIDVPGQGSAIFEIITQ